MKLRVGQVLYIVLTKQTMIYPMQVAEEITKKTLEGTETDYVLRAGGTEPKTIKLKEIQGEIFETADKARAVLIDRASKSIVKLVEAAAQKAQEWYPGSFEGTTEDNIIDAMRKPQNDDSKKQPGTLVELENGVVARVKLPDVLVG